MGGRRQVKFPSVLRPDARRGECVTTESRRHLGVVGDNDESIAGLDDGLGGRLEFDDPGSTHAADGPELRRTDDQIAEPRANQIRAPAHVDVGTPEVGDLCHHLTEPLLAQCEHQVAGNRLRHHDRMNRVGERSDNGLGNHRFVEHDDDRRQDVGTEHFANCQHGVHGPGITDMIAVAVQHHHGSAVAESQQFEIGESRRVAGAEHQAIPERALDALTNLLVQVRWILVGHHDDCNVLARVGEQQLFHHTGQESGGPQHHDVLALDDGAPTGFIRSI